MRVLVVVLLLCVALVPVADAGKRHDRRDRVIVTDYTASPVIAETVADFNRVMPRRGPRLVYRAVSGQCAQPLTVCPRELDGFAGLAYIGANRIEIDPDYRESENVACHEFMHVLARVGDNYDSDPASCLYGQLDDPGPTDIALLRERYGRRR
jgi:hypothetical protein